MNLLARLMALFVVVPVIELVLLLQVGQRIGFLPTVALIIITGVLGAALARREGLRALRRIRSDVQGGRFPVGQLMDGVLVLVAGALLVTPGLLTDVVGLGLLVPGTRGWVRRIIAARVRAAVEAGRMNVTLYYDEPPPPGRAL